MKANVSQAALLGIIHALLYSQGDLNQKGECAICGAEIGDDACKSPDCPVSAALEALGEL